MKLSNLTDEELRKVALLKTKKGTATSDAKRAQQILYTRNITHGGFGYTAHSKYDKSFKSNLDNNITREYKTFEELNGITLEEWLTQSKGQGRSDTATAAHKVRVE